MRATAYLLIGFVGLSLQASTLHANTHASIAATSIIILGQASPSGYTAQRETDNRFAQERSPSSRYADRSLGKGSTYQQAQPGASAGGRYNASAGLSNYQKIDTGRSDPRNNDFNSRDASGGGSLLLSARQALAQGDSRLASELISRAKAQGRVYKLHEDSPEKVDTLIRRYNQKFAAGLRKSDPRAASDYANFLMDQADALIRHQDFKSAEDLALQAKALPVNYRQFERTPNALLNQIASMRRPSSPASSRGYADSNSSRLPPVSEASVSKKSEARRLIAEARLAMDHGNLSLANRLATQAKDLRVPDSAFGPNETRPWQVLLDINNSINRRGQNVVQAGNLQNQNSRYTATQSLYTPQNDRSRNALVSNQSPLERMSPGDFDSSGQRYYNQGMIALEQQDRGAALQLFNQAWQYEDQLDPSTRRRLKDKLVLLQTANRVNRNFDGRPERLASASGQQNVLRQKMFQEITSEQAAADRMVLKDDSRGALARIEKLRDRVNQSQLDPASKKQLLTIVDRNLNRINVYIDENRSDIELRERNTAVRDEITRDRQSTLEVQQKVSELVNEYNQLMDEQRYPEAEVIAKQAHELDPNAAVVQNLIWQSRFVNNFSQAMDIRARSEAGVIDVLNSVHASASPIDDRTPYLFGDAREWEDLTRSRRRLLERQRNRMSPGEMEIQKALSNKVEANFIARPLAEVAETLGKLAGVGIYLDTQGLIEEGVTSDMPVTLNLTQPVSLRSALNLILDQRRLSFVIRDEVIYITTQQARDENTYNEVYYVADLVTPIPNFVPSYDIGLPGAIRAGYQTLGYGGFANPVGGMPFAMASNNPSGDLSQSASVLAQANGGNIPPLAMMPRGSGNVASGRPMQSMGYGPNGMGGGPQADFDSLIELITTTIDPDSWEEVGGAGAIQEFESNLSLVVSQTQQIHERIADLLKQLRRLQDLQVTIEVRFITLSDDFFERIGIDFDFDVDDNFVGNITDLDDNNSSVTIGLDPVTGLPTPDLDVSFSQDSFSATIPQFGGFDPATAANFGFAILSDIEVFFLLQASQADNRTNVLQAPRVTLFNGQSANVSDQSQRPFVTGVIPVVGDFAAAHQPVITVLNEGTSLNVQAVVSSDRRFVRLTLVPFFSTIGNVEEFTFTGSTTTNTGTNIADPSDPDSTIQDSVETTTQGTTVQLPTLAFTTVTTTVSVPDGGTVLLGGIKRLSEGRREQGVPLLSKLPYVNRLFKNVGIGRTTQSLMMMVTPRIIIQEEEELEQTGFSVDQ